MKFYITTCDTCCSLKKNKNHLQGLEPEHEWLWYSD